MADSRETSVAIGSSGIIGSVSWGIIFFIVGLFVYGNFIDALMLGIFAWISTIVLLLAVIPIAGFILWIFINFFWLWGLGLSGALGLPADTVVAVAWFVPSIILLIFGIITSFITIAIIGGVISDGGISNWRSQPREIRCINLFGSEICTGNGILDLEINDT